MDVGTACAVSDARHGRSRALCSVTSELDPFNPAIYARNSGVARLRMTEWWHGFGDRVTRVLRSLLVLRELTRSRSGRAKCALASSSNVTET